MKTINVLFSDEKTIVKIGDKEFNIGDPNKVSVKRETLESLSSLSFQYSGLEEGYQRAILRLVRSNKNVFSLPIYISSRKEEPIKFDTAVIKVAREYDINIKYKGNWIILKTPRD